MKYKRQKRFSGMCGPVVVYNTLKWLGKKANLKKITKETKYSKKEGTPVLNVLRVLKKYGIKLSIKRWADTDYLMKSLTKNKAIIYVYNFDDNVGHYVLLTNLTKTKTSAYFTAINECTAEWGQPVKKVHYKFYKRREKYSAETFLKYGEKLPQAWIIEGKK